MVELVGEPVWSIAPGKALLHALLLGACGKTYGLSDVLTVSY